MELPTTGKERKPPLRWLRRGVLIRALLVFPAITFHSGFPQDDRQCLIYVIPFRSLVELYSFFVITQFLPGALPEETFFQVVFHFLKQLPGHGKRH